MDCEQRRDLLILYAVEALEPAESAALAAHLATGCPRCAGGLVEAQAVLGHLPLVLDPLPPSAEVRAALMRRIAAAPRRAPAAGPVRAEDAAPVSPRAGAWITPWIRPVLAAAAAALVTAVALGVPSQRARQALLARVSAQDREIARLQEAMRDAAETVRVLRSPAVRVVALSGAGPQPQAAARIFWDQSRRTWHFYAAALRPPGPGRTYQLWFITPAQAKIPAATFDVDPSGEAALEIALPPGLEAIALAAVTDEPAGGSPQPTGSIHLAGAVSSPST
jgi:anti-sigma-K factor RskA